MKLLILYEATMGDIERRLPLFLKQYFGGDESKESLDIIRQLAELDPTKGKYTGWVLRQYKKEAIRVPEDNENIAKNLAKFHKVKGKLENKDLNSYTPGGLAKALEPHGEESKRQTRKLGRKGKLVLPPDGAELVIEKGKYKAVKITTVKAATTLSSGTEWCTANPVPAKEYLDDGPLYIIYVGGKRTYLVHYETGQFKDHYDDEVDPKLKFELVDLLEPATGKSQRTDPRLALAYAQDIIKGRWPEGEPVILKSAARAVQYASRIIGGRWPEAEPIIAKDPDAASSYAIHIIKGRWPEAEPAIATDAEEAYAYIRQILKRRWPEAEPVIMKDVSPHETDETAWSVAVTYAVDYVKGRWLEAEPYIMKDTESAVHYARAVIKGRWPEAEPYIMRDPKTVYTYARDVIKGRWPEAEPYIMKDAYFAYLYASRVIKGRWPEAEPYIMKDAYFAYLYAKEVVKDRWPEAEPSIAKDKGKWRSYAENLVGRGMRRSTLDAAYAYASHGKIYNPTRPKLR